MSALGVTGWSNVEFDGPGIYTDMPDAQYRSIDAASQSLLKKFGQSARAARYYMDHRVDSDAFRLGRAADTLVLDPGAFDSRFVEYRGSEKKDGSWTTERRGAGWTKFKADAKEQGLDVLSDSELAEARGMAEAAHQHPTAGGLLKGGQSHVCVFWEDELTGLLCKAQLDYWQPEAGRIVDVKTTKDIAPRDWGAASYRYGYHCQAYWYGWGMGHHVDRWPEFVNVAIEKNSSLPDVVCYAVPQILIAIGGKQMRSYLNEYALARESGNWPGISDHEFLETQVPSWVGGT